MPFVLLVRVERSIFSQVLSQRQGHDSCLVMAKSLLAPMEVAPFLRCEMIHGPHCSVLPEPIARLLVKAARFQLLAKTWQQ